jgi:hypothetical protein
LFQPSWIPTRDSFKKAIETRDRLVAEEKLGANGMPEGVNTLREYQALVDAKPESEKMSQTLLSIRKAGSSA